MGVVVRCGRWEEDGRETYVEDSGHGRDVETEETAADTCEGACSQVEGERGW